MVGRTESRVDTNRETCRMPIAEAATVTRLIKKIEKRKKGCGCERHHCSIVFVALLRAAYYIARVHTNSRCSRMHNAPRY